MFGQPRGRTVPPGTTIRRPGEAARRPRGRGTGRSDREPGGAVVATTMLELFKQGGRCVRKATKSPATTGADVGDAGSSAGMGDCGERGPWVDGGSHRRPLRPQDT